MFISQGVGWLIVVLIWCLPFLIGLGLLSVLFYRHFRKTCSPLSALLRTVLLATGLLLGGILFSLLRVYLFEHAFFIGNYTF